ncbi:MAG: hypothetical protein ACTSQY_04530 [Candidatus Odinarchaeia archaeon]
MPKTKSIPLGVIIVSVLTAIGGILNIIAGVTYALGAPFMGGTGYGLSMFLLGIIWLIWGIILLSAAFALYRLEPWAWTFVVVVSIINLVLGILFAYWLTAVIAVIILVYLFVRRDEFKG